MSEILKPSQQALIARFMYEDGEQSRVKQANQYVLNPGEGILFYGDEDKTSVAATFQQSEIVYVLETLQQGSHTLQLMALITDSL